jgi:glycosyltransferase involved in cell wall biosynthesis
MNQLNYLIHILIQGDGMQPVIIYPPTIDWDQLHQRPQQLLKAMSRLGAISLFCNLNLHGRHSAGLERISNNLILANGMPLDQTIAWARTAYPSCPVVIYYTYPPHVYVIDKIKTDLVIFDSVDEPAGEFVSWYNGYAQAIARADIVIASACSLVDGARRHTDKPVHLIPNGCDYEHFARARQRQFVDNPSFNQGKSIIGYIGAIAPWLDWRLINTMAHCLPEYQFVFIGSPLIQYGVTFANKNMDYPGHIHYEELPRYLSNFSFCLIPFKLTAMTRGVNPIKFWEYLASGIPILSTALPEIPAGYATIINEDMFPGFQPVPDDEGREARIALARNNSWSSRAERMVELIRFKIEQG